MTSELTDKNMILISRLGDFWITEKNAKNIMGVKAHEPDAMVELDGDLISCRSIDGILTAESYDLLNKRRRGAWQCKWKYWHERGQQCAHQHAPYSSY